MELQEQELNDLLEEYRSLDKVDLENEKKLLNDIIKKCNEIIILSKTKLLLLKRVKKEKKK